MPKTAAKNDVEVLGTIVNALRGLETADIVRILGAVRRFLSVDTHAGADSDSNGSTKSASKIPAYSDESRLSPKDFMMEKKPQNDIERITCLAYYLTHYRETPYFKTLEISKLNTEAAQPKFSNAAFTANNALQRGLLVQATKGAKQLSAIGEQFVRALPDRERAGEVLSELKSRRGRSLKKKNSKKALAE